MTLQFYAYNPLCVRCCPCVGMPAVLVVVGAVAGVLYVRTLKKQLHSAKKEAKDAKKAAKDAKVAADAAAARAEQGLVAAENPM